MKILFENKQLNEGPGAGYTVSGTLTNVKVNKIEYINKMGKNSDLVEYEVGVDASADFEDVSANSYYYGGTIDSTPVAIDRVVVEFDDGDITEDDIKWAIDKAKIEANLGGGWSHSTFDGKIDVDYMSIENASSLNAISFEFVDKGDVAYLDMAVQGDEEEDFDESLKEDITDDIKKETDDALTNGSTKEMSNVIFDTLFGNTHYPQFDFSKVENQEVDANKGQIVFDYMGHEYKITIEETSDNFTESCSKSLTEDFDEDERINH